MFRCGDGQAGSLEEACAENVRGGSLLPIAVQRKSQLRWLGVEAKPRNGDLLYVLIAEEGAEEAVRALEAAGWEEVLEAVRLESQAS
jgi:hypothetical protein